MVKYYLVPMIGDGFSVETAFRPKYIRELGLSTSAMDFNSEGYYMVSLDDKESEKIKELEKNSDVIDISNNNKSNKDIIKTLLNIDVKAGEDIIEKLGKSKESTFNKSDFKIPNL